jgi:hypothetical protein
MLRRDRLSSLTSSVESALLNPTPLLTQGQVTALAAICGDQGRPAFSSAREYHQWRKARGREAKECLRLPNAACLAPALSGITFTNR